jgi:hypothetical protein
MTYPKEYTVLYTIRNYPKEYTTRNDSKEYLHE